MSKEAGRKYTVIENIPYGGLDRERLSIFPAEIPGAKTLVFIHGGYWYKNNPSDFYLIAEAFRKYGITIVLIGYPLMPDFSMDQLVLSCRKAINWLFQNLSAYNGDPLQMFVSGHSAGAHLSIMMMATNWKNLDEILPLNTIKGVIAISGLYNLLPVQICYVNDILQMDTETALRNSPVQLLPITPCSLVLAVGGDESAEYKAQSREMFANWKPENEDISLLEIPALNHFSMLTTLTDQSSLLHMSLCQLMGIGNL